MSVFKRIAAVAAMLFTSLFVPVVSGQDTTPAVSFSGISRARFEYLDGQFRRGLAGSDKVLAERTLLQASADWQRFSINLEMQDSRIYLDDAGTPLSGSFVNALELIQTNVAYRPSLPASARISDWEVKLGRFTLDIGSRRFVERNDYRNTINGYSGVHSSASFVDQGKLDVFVVAPMNKKPSSRDDLDRNHAEADEESDTRQFWGIHYQRPNTFPGVQLDLLVYGLEEKDGDSQTLDRSVYAPGFRFLKTRQPARWDFELEAAFRFGEQSSSVAIGAPRVDVRANMVHAEFGYTFSGPWNHRLSLEYDLADGDDANTGRYERYDRFYGTRRGDLGNTSIHGPLTRSNAKIPGLRWMFARGDTDGRVVFQHALLDSASDAWIVARHRDVTGASGTEVGTTLDFRLRHWLMPQRLRLEVGGSALWFGEFAKEVPGGPDGSRTLFAYSELVLNF